ncbi:MAG: PASTA domain-containing protein [Actinomycetota bacterium]
MSAAVQEKGAHLGGLPSRIGGKVDLHSCAKDAPDLHDRRAARRRASVPPSRIACSRGTADDVRRFARARSMRPICLTLMLVLLTSCTSANTPPGSQPTTASPSPGAAVPEVVGGSASEARAELVASGLQAAMSRVSDREPRGTVISQDPAAGNAVETGSSVRLLVSTGWPTLPAFDTFGGIDLQTARERLRERGLRPGNIEPRLDRLYSLFAPGTVFDSRPDRYTQDGEYRHLRPGTRVTLIVAEPFECTPGYSPCLPPHVKGRGFGIPEDYDCAGGVDDGPYYVYSTVRVTGRDVYGLDRDHDDFGCG